MVVRIEGVANHPVLPERAVLPAILDGARGRCPACHGPGMFAGYLRIADHCTKCGEALHHHRADDAPPYFTIFIVGHIIVGLVLSVEVAFGPPLWLHALIWGPLTLGLALAVLPPVKGALVALQWALRMHGFGGVDAERDPHMDTDRLTLKDNHG
ncbi:MAG: DUF983 domain-containing protein [Rhizobiales bacterium]|nr:DUF983 domain-containing protein [Hyphomicrobiales bacterium]